MNRVRVQFFCGERSTWGNSHLEPLLANPDVEVVRVVFATSERWLKFRRALSGEAKPLPAKLRFRVRLQRALKRDQTSRAVKLCERYRVPVDFVEDVNDEKYLARLREGRADWIFSAAYPQIFRSPLLASSRIGAANSHPSLLPRCR